MLLGAKLTWAQLGAQHGTIAYSLPGIDDQDLSFVAYHPMSDETYTSPHDSDFASTESADPGCL